MQEAGCKMMVSVGEFSSGMLLPIEGGLIQVPPPYTHSKGVRKCVGTYLVSEGNQKQ